MSTQARIFAGEALTRLRANQCLLQSQLAERLGISASYLSQLEHNDRPLTQQLIEKLTLQFPLDWQEVEVDEGANLVLALRDALGDHAQDEMQRPDQLAQRFPALANRIVELHEAYRHASQRLEMLDESISEDAQQQSRLPWEEVRDWFHTANNYVDPIDRAAESLAQMIADSDANPSPRLLEEHLQSAHGVKVERISGGPLREYRADERRLLIDGALPPAGFAFQMAYQLAVISLHDEITAIASKADFRSETARSLLTTGLANYAAGAILMPYSLFRKSARSLRHDIDKLSQQFGTSFEQTCHRLSTLQRENERGLPVFFCRVDMAGNITKRHSATKLQFARFGGACPLWIVHEAAAIPDRILVQLAQTPNGERYVSMAKGLVKPSGSFDRPPRRYAVALGCEVKFAHEFVYADGLDLNSERAATKIGISCRICPRENCDQRAFPPIDRAISVDLSRRDVVPYALANEANPRG